MTTVDRTQPSSEHLGTSLEFETLIADLSSRFINLPPREVDREIENALRRVCEVLEIDFAVLWQWSARDLGDITPTHGYPGLNDQRVPDPGTQESYPWIVQQMLAGRTVAISSLEKLPGGAAVDRESARKIGIKSNLTIPLAVGGGAPVGALAFNALGAARNWPDQLVLRLQLVAQVFTNALVRRRHELNLKESEERLALAADSAGSGLWTLDFSTGVFWATEGARALFGYAPDEVLTMERFGASVHPDDWDRVRGAVEQSARSGESIDEEYRIILPGDGHVRWIESRGRTNLTPTGAPDRMMGVSIDVSDRKRVQESLRISEARLASGADLAGLGFYEVDFDEGVMYVDDRMRELCGVPPEREQGLGVLEFWLERLHPGDRERVLQLRDRLHDGRLNRISLDYRFLHPARGDVWIKHLARAGARDAHGRAVATFGVLRDITESKMVEEELRELSRRLIGAHEEERALLARELHDDVTQQLAVLAIDVGRVESGAPDRAQVETMSAVREKLVRLSEDIHALAYQLHPSVLEELGLAEALRTECERRGRQGRIAVSLDLDPPRADIGKDASLCLFRVAQEALSNVARHAGARAATVTLHRTDDGLLLAVRDDGVGFDPAHPEKSRSLGMVSMRERMRLANGTLEIDSEPGRGTTVVAWVPAEGQSP